MENVLLCSELQKQELDGSSFIQISHDARDVWSFNKFLRMFSFFLEKFVLEMI